MQREYTFVPMTKEYLESARELFIENYIRVEDRSPLLSSRVITEPEWIYHALDVYLANPGVAVVEGNHLIAYMLTGLQFPWKGQQAPFVPEYCHGSVGEQKRLISMVASLGINISTPLSTFQ